MAVGWKKDYFRYKEFFLNILSIYNSKPNLKIYLELVLSLSTIVIFALFAIKPTILTIIELSNKIHSKEDVLLKLRQKIVNLQEASNLLQSSAEDLSYIEQSIPSTSSPEILIKQLELLAIQSSLQITGFSSSDIVLVGVPNNKTSADLKSLTGNAGELPFSLSVSGSYQNLFSFLTNIEFLRRAIKIDSIAINANNTDNGKVITMTILGRVPFLTDK